MIAALVVAMTLTARPVDLVMVEPLELMHARPGIEFNAHLQCLEWWKEWATQNRELLKSILTSKDQKKAAEEHRCLYVSFMYHCGMELDSYELPGSVPGSGHPSFSNYWQWADAMSEDYKRHCFEYDKDSDDVSAGKPIGETPRVKLASDEHDDFIRRRTQPLRKLQRRVGLARPADGDVAKTQKRLATGTK